MLLLRIFYCLFFAILNYYATGRPSQRPLTSHWLGNTDLVALHSTTVVRYSNRNLQTRHKKPKTQHKHRQNLPNLARHSDMHDRLRI